MSNIKKRLSVLETKQPMRQETKLHADLEAALQRVEAGQHTNGGLDCLVYNIYHGKLSMRIDSIRELDCFRHLPLYQTILSHQNETN